MPPLHALFITHTHERIARTLMGMHAQTLAPSTITVACDSDDHRIEPEIQRASNTLGMPILLVLRQRSEIGCRSQNRNNAARARLEQGTSENDRFVFYDGDCIPCPTSNAVHMNALDQHALSLGWATRLTHEQTIALTDEQILAGHTEQSLSMDQSKQASKAHLKTRKRILLKRIGLTKPHKPGIFSGNFGIRLNSFCAVNGFDESYTGWGMEDDDLARRLYQSGVWPISVMNRSVVYHQDHPTEEPMNWKDSPNAHRLDQPARTRCQFGLDNPAQQHTPIVIEVTPSE